MFLVSIIGLLVTVIDYSACGIFYGTLTTSWYPEITRKIDMIEYLKGNVSLMTTSRVSFRKKRDDPAVLEAIVGDVSEDKYYTLTQCIFDLFTRDEHKIQLIFNNSSELQRVVELLMLKDDPRIWIHLDLVPLPNRTVATTNVLKGLNAALRWSKMVLSIGCRPAQGNLTELYTPSHARDMKQITEQQGASNMSTVFVLDGYIAQKQPNFRSLMGNIAVLGRVSFLLRIAPDKEDKVVVRDLNETLFTLGGKYRAYLDSTPRLRQIVLNLPVIDRKVSNMFLPVNATEEGVQCPSCKPMIIRKYLRCSAEMVTLNRILIVWMTLVVVGVLL